MKAFTIGVISDIMSDANFLLSSSGWLQLQVGHQRDPVGERATALGVGARSEQHAPHIRVHDDRVGRRARVI